MKVYLSYLLDEQSVVWPGEPTVRIRQTTSIAQDGYNSFQAILPNHHGTHMDGPRHFNPNGPSLIELPIEYFCFDHVAAIDVPKSKGEGVTQDDLKAWEPEIRSADLLLIKTGFCLQRDTQPRVYESEGPYLTPEACPVPGGDIPGSAGHRTGFSLCGKPGQPALQTSTPDPVWLP